MFCDKDEIDNQLNDLLETEINLQEYELAEIEISLKNNKLTLQRLSFVGELGWEIYVPINISREIYLELVKVGEKYNLSHAGAHALDIMRMEKGYLHWGHDISPEENPYEAGLGFAVKLDKNYDFIGKDSLIKIKNNQKKTAGNFNFK